MRLGCPQAFRPREAGPETGMDTEPLAHVHLSPGFTDTWRPASHEHRVEKGSESTAVPLGMGYQKPWRTVPLGKVQPGWGQVRGSQVFRGVGL